MNRIAIGFLGLAAIAGGVWAWRVLDSSAAEPIEATAEGRLDDATARKLVELMKAQPRQEAQPVPKAAKAKVEHVVTYPDGSRWPALNGCQSLEIQWPYGEEYSPIIGRRTDERGQAWYEHEDGSWSTMQRMEIQGVMQDVPQVCIPKPVQPVDPDGG